MPEPEQTRDIHKLVEIIIADERAVYAETTAGKLESVFQQEAQYQAFLNKQANIINKRRKLEIKNAQRLRKELSLQEIEFELVTHGLAAALTVPATKRIIFAITDPLKQTASYGSYLDPKNLDLPKEQLELIRNMLYEERIENFLDNSYKKISPPEEYPNVLPLIEALAFKYFIVQPGEEAASSAVRLCGVELSRIMSITQTQRPTTINPLFYSID